MKGGSQKDLNMLLITEEVKGIIRHFHKLLNLLHTANQNHPSGLILSTCLTLFLKSQMIIGLI